MLRSRQPQVANQSLWVDGTFAIAPTARSGADYSGEQIGSAAIRYQCQLVADRRPPPLA
jgi:hypothetical protein